jgi:hypothetical protein
VPPFSALLLGCLFGFVLKTFVWTVISLHEANWKGGQAIAFPPLVRRSGGRTQGAMKRKLSVDHLAFMTTEVLLSGLSKPIEKCESLNPKLSAAAVSLVRQVSRIRVKFFRMCWFRSHSLSGRAGFWPAATTASDMRSRILPTVVI